MTPVEFPKWVAPHGSHIVESLDGTVRSTPMFPDFHIDRLTGVLTVLVHSAEEEAKAIAEMISPKDQSGLKTDGPTVAEYVAAGYSAKGYPPAGYAAKSGPDEVDAAIKAEEQAEQAKNSTTKLAPSPTAKPGETTAPATKPADTASAAKPTDGAAGASGAGKI